MGYKNQNMKANKQTDKFISNIEDAKIYFEELAAKKQESFDSKSERWQESDKASEMQEEISNLEELAGECENIIDTINNLFEAE